MEYRRLGRTGLKLSEIGLGGWLTFGEGVGAADADRIIRRAFDLGVNFYDTANIYATGESERIMGQALSQFPREELVIASKVRGRMWPGPLGEGLSRKHIVAACDHSLKRLGLDYIDLYQIHWPDAETPIEETLQALSDLVHQGKVLYVGCSNFTAAELQDALDLSEELGLVRMDSMQPHYNMIFRSAEEALLPLCAEEGVGAVVYSPLAQGLLSGRYRKGYEPAAGERSGANEHFRKSYLTDGNLAVVGELVQMAEKAGRTMAQYALAWILRRPEITSVIVGASKIAQIEDNVKASGYAIPEAELAAIDEVMRGIVVRV
jgi:aryl-alcohol dehydrogenase-like predicted oxidoreductase